MIDVRNYQDDNLRPENVNPIAKTLNHKRAIKGFSYRIEYRRRQHGNRTAQSVYRTARIDVACREIASGTARIGANLLAIAPSRRRGSKRKERA